MPQLTNDPETIDNLLGQVAIEPPQTYLREVLRAQLRIEALLTRIAEATEAQATEPVQTRKTRAA